MSRHLIPIVEGSGVWSRNLKKGFRQFLDDRTGLICDALEGEAHIKLFRQDRKQR
jgi:hypothetical protein